MAVGGIAAPGIGRTSAGAVATSHHGDAVAKLGSKVAALTVAMDLVVKSVQPEPAKPAKQPKAA
jgi:hypothetical protein